MSAHGTSENSKTTRYGSVAILFAFLCPPAGIVYAARCLREAGKFNESKTLAYAAFGFVAFFIVLYSLLFAGYTRDLPLIVRG